MTQKSVPEQKVTNIKTQKQSIKIYNPIFLKRTNHSIYLQNHENSHLSQKNKIKTRRKSEMNEKQQQINKMNVCRLQELDYIARNYILYQICLLYTSPSPRDQA
eukprot:TRINITY_DN16940_c0_g1_i1.p4 TRINITY_DN16940_c0_g1~~TRINITY_DN16940_c0_g1_i1.p4  ORF type:complete len:104 (+),score=11.41 TRINITY_DN16940_c0_g1_i1:211-522(+)